MRYSALASIMALSHCEAPPGRELISILRALVGRPNAYSKSVYNNLHQVRPIKRKGYKIENSHTKAMQKHDNHLTMRPLSPTEYGP